MGRTYDPKLVETTVKTVQMLSVDAVENARAGMPDQVTSRIRAWLG